MASDWEWIAWFDDHAGALSALAGIVVAIFTVMLYNVGRRQAEVSAEQAAVSRRQNDISERQARIAEAQHALQMEQDKRSRPQLQVNQVTGPRWVSDQAAEVIVLVGNTGGSPIGVHEVVFHYEAATDPVQYLAVGRITQRSTGRLGLLLQPSEAASFMAQVVFDSMPKPDGFMRLHIRALDGSLSNETLVKPPHTWNR